MQTKLKKLNRNNILKGVLFLFVAIVCFYAGHAFADSTPTNGISGIATTVTGHFEAIGKLMIAVSYLAGIGFVLASLFKFKQHKDNPTQITLGTPLALLVIGILLIFLPLLIKPAGESIFGQNAKSGGFTGAGVSSLQSGGN